MGLFGKKKEETKTCCCSCGTAKEQTATTNTCCGEKVDGICCIKVLGAEGEIVYVSVDVEISYDGKTQKNTIKVGLIEEESGWRLNSPTYASYNEYLDIYDELQKG